MKKYTQEDFEKFEIVDGIRQCPSGDYTLIKNFGEWCSFGERCSFGKCCSFGEWCSFGEHCSFGEGCKVENDKEMTSFLKFEGFGRERRCTYFFKLTDGGIYVRCGCFAGYLDEFRNKVRETHGDGFYAEGYLKIADLAEWQLEGEVQNA